MVNPVFYISHGAPNTVLYESRTKKNLKKLEKYLRKGEYILMISAHWASDKLHIIEPSAHKLMYDFYGFERELYEYKYDIKSDPKISKKVFDVLEEFDISYDMGRKSFDHGVWSVLSMITPALQLPVIQLSLPVGFNVERLISIGEKLRPLRDKALIICSGSLTHNLRDMDPSNEVKEYVSKFNENMVELLKKGDLETLADYENIPYFRENHPTSEHFMPIFIALGASNDKVGESINREFIYSTVSMESFIFKN